jgi:hypothetical protein
VIEKEDTVEKKVCRKIDLQLVRELLVFDLYARENVKKEPEFLENRELSAAKKEWQRAFYQKETLREKYFSHYQDYSWKQVLRMTHIEWFTYDIPAFIRREALQKKETIVLFDYAKRNPLNHQAAFCQIDDSL